jgi:aminomethyltransferase
MAKATPFQSVHAKLGAEFADYHGWTMPSRFGDITQEYEAFKNHIAAFDLSHFGRIQIKGADHAGLIEEVTSDGLRPQDDQWLWAAVHLDSGPAARIRVASSKNVVTVITHPQHREVMFKRLKEAAGQKGMSAKVTDVTEKTAMLAIYGPEAFEVISGIMPFDMSGLVPGAVTAYSFFMMSILAFRGSWLDSDGLELICPASAAGLAGQAITRYKDQKHITPAGTECLLRAMGELAQNSVENS